MNFNNLFKSILVFSLAGAGIYSLLLIATLSFGFNPLVREYSPLQALFVPFVVGGCIAVYHYRQRGQRKLLEMGVFGLGVALLSPILYGLVFWIFLMSFPELVADYLSSAMNFLESNKEVYIRFSGPEEYELARKNLQNTTPIVIFFDDLIKKILIGFPFTILFLLLFFAMPAYFRRPKPQENGK